MEETLKKIIVKIINAQKSTTSIDWLFKTIKNTEVRNYSLDNLKSINFESESEILIVNLVDFDMNNLHYFQNYLSNINYNSLIILTNQKILPELTYLIREGVNKIFVYPEEQYVLRNYIIEIIEKLKLNLSKKLIQSSFEKKFSFSQIIGKSEPFLKFIKDAKNISQSKNVNVLLLGETGTGKELFAKAIHYNSELAEEPFVEINVSAIPETLFESELFGYEKGSFTDAKTSKPGLLEIAEKGTVFLDEIGDLSINLQVKLLRAIENKVIKRIGGVKDIKIQCRFITATNQNLVKLIEEKKFRADLYYRLNVMSIYIPPLRERKEDIILLTEYFIQQFNIKYDKNISGITESAKSLLLDYSWPGNVRELSNVIERAVLLCNRSKIDIDNIQLGTSSILTTMKKNTINLNLEIDNVKVDNVLKELASQVLTLVGGNKSKAAKLLGVSRPKLLKILNEKNN